jgi:hypothetical protein
MRKGKAKPMRADYSKADLGPGVRGKYLRDYYAIGEGGAAPAAKPARTKKASPPPKRKRR